MGVSETVQMTIKLASKYTHLSMACSSTAEFMAGSIKKQ